MGQRAHVEEKYDKQVFCQHQFFEIYRYTSDGHQVASKEGDEIWFYCDKCLLTVKKKLIDQSNKL